jgi:predicted dienelactone hydrolase
VRRPAAIAVLVAIGLLATACGGSGADSQSASHSASSATTEAQGRVRLIAPDGLANILGRERRAARRARESATTAPTTAAPTTTTAPPITGTFAVATLHQTFVDSTRPTPARGGAPAATSRTIATTIYYPAKVAPSADDPTPAASPGAFPLIVFAHGYAIDAAAYAPLLQDLAAGGFVVAAPDFPGTSTAYPGGALRSDSLEQPADISFVISSMITVSGTPGPLFGSVNAAAVGDSGQSDGGVTAAAAAYNTCCIDPRIKASSILTGGAFGFDGQWFPPGTPPVLFVHATADEVNPYGASTSMFEQAQSPKYLFTIEGGSHLEVYVDPPWEQHVAAAMVAFFDLYLKGDQSAAERLTTAGSQPGYTLQSG